MDQHYIISLDPAKLRDYSALAVIRVQRQSESEDRTYQIVFLKREQNLPYPQIIDWSKKVYLNPKWHIGVSRPPQFILDAGGVGVAIQDMFTKVGVDTTGITLTGGDAATKTGKNYHVSKSLVIGKFLGSWDCGRVQIPLKASFLGLFSGELKAFRGEMTKSGRTKFEAEEGEHDDLVMAVAQAVWYGEDVLGKEVSIPCVLSSLISLSRLCFTGFDVKFTSIDGPEDDTRSSQIKAATRQFRQVNKQIGRIGKSKKLGLLPLIRYAALEGWSYREAVFQFETKHQGSWVNPAEIQALPTISFARPAASITSEVNRYTPDKIMPGIVFDREEDQTRFFQSQRIGDVPQELDPESILYIEDIAMPDGISMMKAIVPIIEEMREADTDGMLALHRVGVPNEIAQLDVDAVAKMSQLDPHYKVQSVIDYMHDMAMNQSMETAKFGLGGMRFEYPNIPMPINPWQVEQLLEKKIVDFWFHRNILEQVGRSISSTQNPQKALLDLHIASEREIWGLPFERWFNDNWVTPNGFDLVIELDWWAWESTDDASQWQGERADFQAGALDINEYRKRRGYNTLTDEELKQLIEHHTELAKGQDMNATQRQPQKLPAEG